MFILPCSSVEWRDNFPGCHHNPATRRCIHGIVDNHTYMFKRNTHTHNSTWSIAAQTDKSTCATTTTTTNPICAHQVVLQILPGWVGEWTIVGVGLACLVHCFSYCSELLSGDFWVCWSLVVQSAGAKGFAPWASILQRHTAHGAFASVSSSPLLFHSHIMLFWYSNGWTFGSYSSENYVHHWSCSLIIWGIL